jgi:putative membrane protein
MLIFTLSAIVLKERGMKNKAWALILVIMSGTLGLFCMDLPIPSAGILGEGTLLFPLLTGLFGIPALLSSFKNTSVPKQQDDGTAPVDHLPGIRGVLMGSVAGWYPGITATAGATISSIFMPEDRPEKFISVIASIGTVTSIFSLITLSVFGSGRTGTVLVIRDIIGDGASGFCSPEFLLLLLCSAVASFIGYHMTISVGKVMSRMTDKIDVPTLNKAVLCLIVLLVLLLTGPFGLLVLAVSVLLGKIPLDIDAARVPLTGCLMLPVIIHGLFGTLA